MKNAMKRWLSLLLTVLMVATALPFAALAEGETAADGLIEETLVPVESEQTTPTVNVSNAVSAAELLAGGEAGTLTNDGISATTITGATTVKVGGTITLTSDKGVNYTSYHKWSSSDENIATVTNNGKSAVVKGISEGEVTITHGYYYWEMGSWTWKSETYSVEVSGTETGTSEKAAVFYLRTPTSDPNSNDKGNWGGYLGDGSVNTTGATWTDNRNIFSPAPYVVSLASGMTKQSDESWLLSRDATETDRNNQTSNSYDNIYKAYKEKLKNDLGLGSDEELKEEDIEAIYLTPYKISKDNGETTWPDKHIDCTISIKTKKFFAARFWVTLPDGTRNLVDSANYRQESAVEKTTVAPSNASGSNYPETKVVDGLTFVFDGWYNEAGIKVSDGQWAYIPDETELADGVVEFEARYVPAETTVTVTKTVSSSVAEDIDREFTFSYTVGGTAGESFTLKNGEYKEITVGIGKTLVVTETVNNAFETTYSIDNGTVATGTAATIQSVAGVGHTIAFTNTRKVTSITAEKVWVDEDNKYNLRPNSINLQLMAGGTAFGELVVLREKNNWSYTWENLPECDANGTAINYTVAEIAGLGYTSEITGNATDGFTVTNTLEKVSITATKEWNDSENAYNTRPASITLKLMADGVAVDGMTKTIAPNTDGTWPSMTWSDLPKYKSVTNADGAKSVTMIVYTVEEEAVAGYESTPGDADNGYKVTNTLKTHTLTIKKTISGNMGVQSKQFAFTTSYGDGDKTADLAHNGTVEYTVPYGASVTVTENPDGYTYSLTSVTGVADREVTEQENGVSFTMPDSDVTVTINNEKEVTVDTGILLDSLPYVLILALVGAALVVWFIRKRRNDD